jgi:hypothetical protein
MNPTKSQQQGTLGNPSVEVSLPVPGDGQRKTITNVLSFVDMSDTGQEHFLRN